MIIETQNIEKYFFNYVDYINKVKKKYYHCSIVIFGITGDLSSKKLIPAIYNLINKNFINEYCLSLIGFARRNWNKNIFIKYIKNIIKKHPKINFQESTWKKFKKLINFVEGSFDNDYSFFKLKNKLSKIDKKYNRVGNYIFYLSISPSNFSIVSKKLLLHKLTKSTKQYWRKVIVEKPFGYDLQSSKKLNNLLKKVYSKESIFRIDHYLGKEIVQNILILRFANNIFEPLWNAKYIDHIQITMAEKIGIDNRANYYDETGALKDVIQNHLLQLLALVTMDQPRSFKVDDLKKRKEEVLSKIKIFDNIENCLVKGQYLSGKNNNKTIRSFLEEKGVKSNSSTESYAAIKLRILNKRWNNVPFYLRTGKRLKNKITKIVLIFKNNPFTNKLNNSFPIKNNEISINIHPDEGLNIFISSKIPNMKMDITSVKMEFNYNNLFKISSPEAYEKLIMDIILGIDNLFPTDKEIELSWKIIDPIENFWINYNKNNKKIEYYEAGTWGPDLANKMLENEGRYWRN